ncbi:MAG: hypothetical protein JW712_03165 [Dehalococcoidales bacterium]|nr:hypothetical protein [Dehalococcoidales bacterium]
MDWNTLIAVLGTLGGAGVAGLITYKIASRQRKWDKEDEVKRIKLTIVNDRIKMIYESVDIMMEYIDSRVTEQEGLPVYKDPQRTIEKGLRLQEIFSSVFANVKVLNVPGLEDHYLNISRAYWDLQEYNNITRETSEKVSNSHLEVIRILDDIRTGYWYEFG